MDEQQKALMDYTKFHIGLYTTLCTLLVGIIGLNAFSGHPRTLIPYLIVTLICFAVAGAFGGLIGSSLPKYQTWTEFREARLGPWFTPKFIPAPFAASAEHTTFWLGTVVALYGVIKTYLTIQ